MAAAAAAAAVDATATRSAVHLEQAARPPIRRWPCFLNGPAQGRALRSRAEPLPQTPRSFWGEEENRDRTPRVPLVRLRRTRAATDSKPLAPPREGVATFSSLFTSDSSLFTTNIIGPFGRPSFDSPPPMAGHRFLLIPGMIRMHGRPFGSGPGARVFSALPGGPR